MLSGIQHFAFCRRQWALIHIEQIWSENLRTAEGRILHEHAHDPYQTDSRGEVIVSRAVPVLSRTLGISGECDIVEFRRAKEGIPLTGREGVYTVYPVEYKRGAPKESEADLLQLAAQAICLEEMLVCSVPSGAIYYGETRRRLKVEFTDELKIRVRELFAEMHRMFQRGSIPKAKPSKSCNACSLREECLPRLPKLPSAKSYNEVNLGEESL